jgi:hypothetical protein
MVFRIESGVTPANWVVNVPNHTPFVPLASRAIPIADNESAVPVEVGARTNGDPARGEHAGRFGSRAAAQIVLFTPGPSNVRSRCRTGLPTNVIKSGTAPPPAFKSSIEPWTPGSNGPPPVYVMFVPLPVWIQPNPPPTGRVQSIVVDVIVTPPPEQLLRFNIPAGLAFTGVDKSRAANIAMTNVPMCFTIVSPVVNDRKTRAAALRLARKDAFSSITT